MSNNEEGQDDRYVVVINDEEQYSLWPEYSVVPNGWTIVFGPAQKPPCLDFVKVNWTDMRPKSLRDAESAHAH